MVPFERAAANPRLLFDPRLWWHLLKKESFSGRKWRYLRKVMAIWVRGQMVVFTQKVLKNLLTAFEQIETFPHMSPLAFVEPFEQIMAFAANGHICRPAVAALSKRCHLLQGVSLGSSL